MWIPCNTSERVSASPRFSPHLGLGAHPSSARAHDRVIVPGGGISLATGEEGYSPTGTKRNERWMACREGFFLPVRVLSRLFRRLFLDKLAAADAAGQLTFFGDHAPLAEAQAFTALIRTTRVLTTPVRTRP